MTYFTIGADIEIFGKYKNSEEHKALCGLIGGTKEKPLQIKSLNNGFMIQEDNVTLEFNIPATESGTHFVDHIRTMREYTEKFLQNLDLEQSKKSSFIFSKNELKHPKALVFGCEPDFDAWKKAENKKPFAENPNLRTAGGHVHVGSDISMIEGIRAMDLFLGVPSVLIDDSPESNKRRELYGKAGAMRPKPYGFEYRVLSNFWMFSDTLAQWIYNNTFYALDFCSRKPPLSKTVGKTIQECINTGNKSLAEKLIHDYGIALPKTTYNREELPKKETVKYHVEMLTDEVIINTMQETPIHQGNI
jgi:hypothetical protein